MANEIAEQDLQPSRPRARLKAAIIGVMLITAILLLLAGLLIDPSWVARHFRSGRILRRDSIDKVLWFQLFTVTAGALLLVVAVGIYRRRLLGLLMVPLLIAYFLAIHAVYIQPKFPANTFLRPGNVGKLWNVLLGKDLFLSDFEPRTLLVTETHQVPRAKYPVINVHAHFIYYIETLGLDEMIRIMDSCGVERAVDLDGYAPNEKAMEKLKERIDSFRSQYRERFIQFYQIWFPDGGTPGNDMSDSFISESVALLEKAVRHGARGLKIWKNLGLKATDSRGQLIAVDDPRLDPIWAKAGDLGVPVLIHVGDPDAMFLPVDRFNERFEELSGMREWSYAGPGFPPKKAIVEQLENVLKKHRRTVFIGAHMASVAEDLSHLSSLLNRHANLYVDVSAQASELGRKPYTTRRFFIEHQDRVLFGTDGNAREEDYRSWFRFLETNDEYFDYPFSRVHKAGRWKIYGLGLPNEVLQKLYYANAARLILKR
jgi:predicted TIM-barrel fold metal-dependent hydrolase